VVRLKITHQPIGVVDGISLDHFQRDFVYDVGSQIGGLLLAERWAEPVDDSYPAPVTPSTDVQTFTGRSGGTFVPISTRRRPPMQQYGVASDRPSRARPRTKHK
jgi:hypothetical protein